MSATSPTTVRVVDDSIAQSKFCQSPAATPLRVCCYGSSSSATPSLYTREASHVGYMLAKRGHTCVNGAGSFGCMAALNDGASQGGGHIVGVIHEMWLVDKGDWVGKTGSRPLRDGGAHDVFSDREMLVASGPDLQERKRLLIKDADALIVLPGGPGTWDELWEMACGRNIGLHNLPICVVNVNGYYQPFLDMLQRAYDEELTKLQPHEIMHFCSSAQEAVEWVEQASVGDKMPLVDLPKRQRSTGSSSPLAWGRQCWHLLLGKSANCDQEATLSVTRALFLVSIGGAAGYWFRDRHSRA